MVDKKPYKGILEDDINRASAILKETADSNPDFEKICLEISDTLFEMDKTKGSFGLEYTFKTFLSAFISGYEKTTQKQNPVLAKVQEVVSERVLVSEGAALEKLFQKEIAKQQKQIDKETLR